MPKPNKQEIELDGDEDVILVDEDGNEIVLDADADDEGDDDGDAGVVYLDDEGDDEDDDGEEIDPEDIDAVLAHNAETIEEQGELLEKMADYIEECEETITKYAGKIEKFNKGETVVEDDDEVFKNATPEMRERFLAVESVAKAAELEKEIAKAREYGVGDAKALAPALMRIRKLCPKEAAVIEKALKTAGGVIAKSGLFVTQGESGEGGDEGSAIAKAKSLAGEIKKSASGANMTEHQRMAQVWSQNPELYEQYQDERRAARG